MFLLPMRGEEISLQSLSEKPTCRTSISSRDRRRFSSRSAEKLAGDGSGSGEQRRISKFSLFFSLFFFLPRLIPLDQPPTVEIDRFHPTTADDGRNRPLPTDSEW
ncbi:hypothetical protein BHM03_00032593 [Ensete ventricosum]|nr:hypothetical protein BHM03_00032593 [Ensete ventricosum]